MHDEVTTHAGRDLVASPTSGGAAPATLVGVDGTAGDDGVRRAGGSPPDPFDALVQAARGVLILAGLVATAPVAATLVLRQTEIGRPKVVAYVASTPFVVLAGVAAAVLFLLARAWWGVAVAGVLTVVLALTQVPLFLGSALPEGPTTTLTVMTLNLHRGDGDAGEVLGLVRGHDVDLLALEELTPEFEQELRDLGIAELLPYTTSTPTAGTHGNGLWSRAPLRPLTTPSGFRHPPVAATMDLDGVEVFVAAVHPLSPFPADADRWVQELDLLREWLGAVDGLGIVGGDFNSTLDHRGFRDILATGYRDAGEQAGVGFVLTYPSNRRRIPALIGIDHVISRGGIVATGVERIDVTGSDHAALIATLVVPTGLGATVP